MGVREWLLIDVCELVLYFCGGSIEVWLCEKEGGGVEAWERLGEEICFLSQCVRKQVDDGRWWNNFIQR